MKPQMKVGPEGDFYTSIYLSNTMAVMIERYVRIRCLARGWKSNSYRVVEWGAGSGKLAEQLLSLMDQSDCTPVEYVIVESSPYHRSLIRERLDGLSHTIPVVCWDKQKYIEYASEMPVFLLANELLDAFPVERVRRINNKFEQAYVRWDPSSSRFDYEWADAEVHVSTWMEQHGIQLHDKQIYDAGIAASEWLTDIFQASPRLEALFIDYGDGSEQLTASHRMNGSLLCYRQHQAYDDPFLAPGDQDMTADVDFDIAERIACMAGCEVMPRMNQLQFLVEHGVFDLLKAHQDMDPFSEKARNNRMIRQLLLSDQMSERFKIMSVYR